MCEGHAIVSCTVGLSVLALEKAKATREAPKVSQSFTIDLYGGYICVWFCTEHLQIRAICAKAFVMRRARQDCQEVRGFGSTARSELHIVGSPRVHLVTP